VKTEKDLSSTQRNSYLKALGAFKFRDYDLVVALMGPVVSQEPEFLAGRKLLREAEVLRARSGNSSLLAVSGSSASIDKSKARHAIEAGDFPEAIREAEKALEADPMGVQPNKDLHEAAEMLARNEREKIRSNPAAPEAVEAARGKIRCYEAIARFALETIALDDRDKAKQAGAFHDLGRYLLSIEEFDEAVKAYEKILQANPSDREARNRAKEARQRSPQYPEPRPYVWIDPFPLPRKNRTMHDGSAEAPGDDRTIREESTEEIAKRVYEAHEAGKPDKELARKLADLYFIREDYDTALEYYRYLSALANDTDPGLLRKISDTEVRRLDQHITNKEKELAALAGDDPASVAMRSEIEELRHSKAEQMLGEARKRVKRNPTDLQYRFELGEQMVLAGHYKEAIPELQQARSNPNTRTKALNLLGKCYIELNMLDLAVKTLTDAAGEIPGMDGIKKAIIYNLGLVYERLGDKEKSLDCMKQIYEDPNSESDDGLAGAPVPVKPSPTSPPKAGSTAKKLPPNQEDNA
jgi:tetratricopeptide (TPR) repeat protein